MPGPEKAGKVDNLFILMSASGRLRLAATAKSSRPAMPVHEMAPVQRGSDTTRAGTDEPTAALCEVQVCRCGCRVQDAGSNDVLYKQQRVGRVAQSMVLQMDQNLVP